MSPRARGESFVLNYGMMPLHEGNALKVEISEDIYNKRETKTRVLCYIINSYYIIKVSRMPLNGRYEII